MTAKSDPAIQTEIRSFGQLYKITVPKRWIKFSSTVFDNTAWSFKNLQDYIKYLLREN